VADGEPPGPGLAAAHGDPAQLLGWSRRRFAGVACSRVPRVGPIRTELDILQHLITVLRVPCTPRAPVTAKEAGAGFSCRAAVFLWST
jgi:hypothetical protein